MPLPVSVNAVWIIFSNLFYIHSCTKIYHRKHICCESHLDTSYISLTQFSNSLLPNLFYHYNSHFSNFSCHDISTTKQKPRFPHGTACFHKYHMLLSYIMPLPYFISTYMKNCMLVPAIDLFPTRHKYKSNPIFRDLRTCTDEFHPPTLIRDSF